MRCIAVVAYIEKAGLLLSVSRKDTGQRAAPGGKVDAGEPWIVAACRETIEETGLDIIRAYPVFVGLHSTGCTVVTYRVGEWHGNPVAREPGTRIEWVTPEVLARGFGADYHRRALRAAGLLMDLR